MPLFNPDRETESPKEELKGLYIETDKKSAEGKPIWRLKEDVSAALSGGDLAKENRALKETVQTLQKKIEGEQLKLKLEKKPETEKAAPETGKTTSETEKAAPEVRELKKLTEALKAKIEEQESKNKEIESSYQQKEKAALVEKAIMQKGGSVKLLSGIVLEKVGLRDGELYIKDKQGDPVYVGSQKLSIEDYLDGLKKDKELSAAFKKEETGVGTGASFPPGSGKPVSKPTENIISAKEEVDFIKAYGAENYLAAMAKISGEKADKIRESHKSFMQKNTFNSF